MMVTAVTNQLQAHEARLERYQASPNDFRLTETGELVLEGGQIFPLEQSVRPQLAKLIGCPSGFFESVPIDLCATMTNRLIKEPQWDGRKCPEQLNITTLDEKVIGVSDANLLTLNATAVLDTVFEAGPESLEREALEVQRFNLSHEAVFLEITTPQRAEPRAGDVVAAGLSISHNYSGSWATQISTYLHRLVCSNGMVVPVCRQDKRLRVRRLESNRFSEADMLDNIRQISRIAWAELSLKLDALKVLVGNHFNEPEAVLRELANRLRLNKKLTQAILDAFLADELGEDASQFGVLNALSRVATHHPNLDDLLRRRLMESAGVLSQEYVHRCPTCLSVVRGPLGSR